MIRKNELFSIPWIAVLLFAIIMTIGFKSETNAADPNDLPSFEGTWTLLQEQRSCDGDFSELTQITIEKNKKKEYSLILFPDSEPLKCKIADNELQCSGKIKFNDGSSLKILESTFWHDSYSNSIEGEAEWIRYDANKNACESSVTFSPLPYNLNFAGTWEIKEALQGCGLDGIIDQRTAEITQNGSVATLSNGALSLDCTVVVGEGLRCAGKVSLDDLTMEYSQSILWFNGEDSLLGNADWKMFSGNTLICTGASTVSAIRSTENGGIN